MRIHRVRALDAVDETLGVLALHFILSFDLIPGHIPCLMMSQSMQPWVIAGPHLLQPQYWDADGLAADALNPLTEENYEYQLYPGRTTTLTALAGDVIQYHDTSAQGDCPPQGGLPDDVDQTSLLQLLLQERLQERNFATAPPGVKHCAAFETPAKPQQPGRVVELFPLLWGDCGDVPLPCAQVEIQRFLQACQNYSLCPTLPDEFAPYVQPVTKAYLDTCVESLDERGELHIYTDIFTEDEYSEREATWAAAVFHVVGARRKFLGWTAGFVSDDPESRTYIGASAKRAMQAERSGIFWILAWVLGLPPHQVVHLYVDNQPACFGATGQWTYNLEDLLAKKVREIMLVVSERHTIRAHHVKSHTLQPQNELVDGIATAISHARHTLAFKNPSIERTIASFDSYEVFWYHQISSGILPPIRQDCLILQPVQDDREFQPVLARSQDVGWTRSSSTTQAKVEITAVTYNVLSLRHCDPTKTIDEDSIFPGKTKYLARQMLDQEVHVMSFQECRGSTSGIFENQDLLRIVAAGTQEGTLGTEVWLNKKQAIGHVGKTPLHFNKTQVLVVHADPRLLIVKVKLPEKVLLIVSGHSPHACDTDDNRRLWWTSITHQIRKAQHHDMLICGCDFNTKISQSALPHVGTLLCDKPNANTPFMMDFLRTFDLFLPSTFVEMHNGPQETWRHPSGCMSRLDYIALQQSSWSSIVSTSWVHLDAGNATPDHFATGVRLQHVWTSSLRKRPQRAIDWEALREPQNREHVCNIIADIPVAPWATMPTKQIQLLHEDITQKLREHFPLKRSRPRKPYISQSTWALRQLRRKILAVLRQLRALGDRDSLRCAWGQWTDVQPGAEIRNIARNALLPLIVHQTLVSLRSTASKLRSHLRADKATFVEQIATHAREADGSEVFKALAPLRVGSKFSKRSTDPLPMWRKPDGEIAATYEERLDVWRNQCSDLEAGHLTTPHQLMCQALDRAEQRRALVPPLSFEEIPSILSLEDRLRKIKRNRTAGNDGLRSDTFALTAPSLARHLFSLSTKLTVCLQEPLICKGGTLAAAFKGSGAADQISNYRSLLLSSHMGKALRSFWRQQTMPLYELASSSLHFAGKRGGNVSHASMTLQNLLSGADQRSRSSCALFLDVSSAYYRVVRDFVVHQTTSDEALARVLKRFGLPPEEYQLLWDHLRQPDILQSIGASTRHRAILDELLTSTWFSIAGDQQIVATEAGSRPGDNLAVPSRCCFCLHLLTTFGSPERSTCCGRLQNFLWRLPAWHIEIPWLARCFSPRCTTAMWSYLGRWPGHFLAAWIPTRACTQSATDIRSPVWPMLAKRATAQFQERKNWSDTEIKRAAEQATSTADLRDGWALTEDPLYVERRSASAVSAQIPPSGTSSAILLQTGWWDQIESRSGKSGLCKASSQRISKRCLATSFASTTFELPSDLQASVQSRNMGHFVW